MARPTSLLLFVAFTASARAQEGALCPGASEAASQAPLESGRYGVKDGPSDAGGHCLALGAVNSREDDGSAGMLFSCNTEKGVVFDYTAPDESALSSRGRITGEVELKSSPADQDECVGCLFRVAFEYDSISGIADGDEGTTSRGKGSLTVKRRPPYCELPSIIEFGSLGAAAPSSRGAFEWLPVDESGDDAWAGAQLHGKGRLALFGGPAEARGEAAAAKEGKVGQRWSFVVGQACPGAIGDLVYVDSNANGEQDNGEPGLPGLVVQLAEEPAGRIVQTLETDENGHYGFENLSPGSYRVRFLLPPSLTLTSLSDGAEADGTSVHESTHFAESSSVIVLRKGERNMGVRAGVTTKNLSNHRVKAMASENALSADALAVSAAGLEGADTATISGRVFDDDDHNGLFDQDESGVEKVPVDLVDAEGTVVHSTKTDSNGRYTFKPDAGTYSVRVDVPEGYDGFTWQLVEGKGRKRKSRADADGVTGKIDVKNGEKQDNVDIGVVKEVTAAFTSKIYVDMDRDSRKDTNETSLPGVEASLIHDGKVVQKTKSNDCCGVYGFNNLLAGRYTVELMLPREMVGFSFPSNISGAAEMRQSEVYEVQNNQTLFDSIWFDHNRNGRHDQDEWGVAGVEVRLMRGGKLVGKTITDREGFFSFEGLADGKYMAEFSPHEGGPHVVKWKPIARMQVDLDKGEERMHEPVGVVVYTGTIGDTVYMDVDGDGEQGPNEYPLPNITVELKDALGHTVNTTQSDKDGKYKFDYVPPGTYQVDFIDTPVKLSLDRAERGTYETINVTGPATREVEVLSGADLVNVDGGMVVANTRGATQRISDRVWEDRNGNGIQDEDDPPVQGVEVRLYEVRDGDQLRLISTDVTDKGGNYSFIHQPPGSFVLEFVKPPEYLNFTRRYAGNNTHNDSNVDPADGKNYGKSSVFTLFAGERNPSIDAGLIKGASVVSEVFIDKDSDGERTRKEKQLSGIQATILRDMAPIRLTKTDKNGKFAFTDLEPGTYEVELKLPKGLTTASFVDKGGVASAAKALQRTSSYVFAADEAVGGERSVVESVFVDSNGNGVRDRAEPGIPDVPVSLLKDGQFLKRTVTDIDGFFGFEGLMPGAYQAEFELDSASMKDVVQWNPITRFRVLVLGGERVELLVAVRHPKAAEHEETEVSDTDYVMAPELTRQGAEAQAGHEQDAEVTTAPPAAEETPNTEATMLSSEGGTYSHSYHPHWRVHPSQQQRPAAEAAEAQSLASEGVTPPLTDDTAAADGITTPPPLLSDDESDLIEIQEERGLASRAVPEQSPDSPVTGAEDPGEWRHLLSDLMAVEMGAVSDARRMRQRQRRRYGEAPTSRQLRGAVGT
ncbi:unnamed protein product [Vitrella brassicaformis CCMP3155]|uniref:SD-repeat containing protein B domain-containing protein n=2 Tax=Vitrella brassicaformis TaxID=1169539 RepID=A0A0G4H334_VITBC|nr:unnamed protein product [Vitrella brassicaformis CCMP3155]|eukprot:CEM38132.1 unnamed protein product [Vitrella brassicaformis CCMP3155]